MLCQNLRLVRRQVQFRPTIQQRWYVTGGCFQEYVDPKLAGAARGNSACPNGSICMLEYTFGWFSRVLNRNGLT